MTKPKKLKVFRTAIGFHDAYVAAPTRKAALEAWGTETNLFARGAAEEVSDARLARAPLERPGEVVRVLRGSEAEQIRALGKPPAKAKRRAADYDRDKPTARTTPVAGRGRKPGRAGVEKAERALAAAEERQRAALAALKAEEEALAQRRRKLEAKQRSERALLEARVDKARDEHSAALARWAED